MGRMNYVRRRTVLGVGAVATAAVLGIATPVLPGVASAQAPVPSPTVSTTTVPVTTTAVPPTDGDGSTTTTAPDPLPGEVGNGDPTSDDPGAKTAYADQVPFDEAMRAPLDELIATAERNLADATDTERRTAADASRTVSELEDLQHEVDAFDIEYQQAISDADHARDHFRDRAVDAYIRGNDPGAELLISANDATDYASRVVLLSSVLDEDKDASDSYQSKRNALDDGHRSALDRLDELRRAVADAQQAADDAAIARLKAEYDVKVAQAGSHVLIEGFQFPVLGVVDFIDSFGFARNTATTYSHWHEGNDLMTDRGTPVIAVEDGTLKASNNFLGGNALRLFSANGYWYYYAHMDAIADGIGDGSVVTAGQVIGYVGNTGDAAGGPTHLHFEIHTPDPGSIAVDPYAILRIAYDTRQAAEALAAAPAPT